VRVVDTSAWIEWLIGSPLGRELAREFPKREDCIVPTLVQLELAKWLARTTDEEWMDRTIAYTHKCRIVALDTVIALRAAELCSANKLATADAIVYATALEHGADLLTCDAHFDGLPGVVLRRKR
jgi:predicted nucleic acid-binding protein